MSICGAINQQFNTRLWPVPDYLAELPALVKRGTRVVVAEEMGFSEASVGDVGEWIDSPNDMLPTIKIGVGHYCCDKSCLRLAPENT